MIDIKLEGIEAALKKFDKQIDNVKFATAKSLTNVAQEAKKGLQEEITKVFDRPTPWVKNSIYVKPATKTNLVSEVKLKDQSASGKSHNPAEKILSPHIYGGQRPMKRSEFYLKRFTAPGAGARLNKYGNMSAGQITQILDSTHTNSDATQWTTKRSKKRNKKALTAFIIRSEGKNLSPGVWQKMANGRVRPLLMFIKSPTYNKRFHFFEVAKKIILAKWATIFHENLQKVINK